MPSPTPRHATSTFDTAQAARIVGLPVERLRRCVRAGLIAPQRTPRGHLRFDFVDLILLRTTRGLLEQRVPLRRISRVLRSLRRQLGQRPLTRLHVFVDGDRVVAWDGTERWQPESGQYLFNFDTASIAKRARSVGQLPDAKRVKVPQFSASEWCDLAMEIEQSSPLEARAAYHHALDLDPGHVVARINLGRLLHADGNLVGAEAHFREAIRADPACALAWYNLGVVLEDDKRTDDAIACYEQAIVLDPNLADAHWNLSLLYERAGRRQDALRHLSIYRRLVPPRR
ncbi:MAG TPA: tetratricopeptide repeat protein [Candidatus Limnocylindria bacterium]|nr:tetratricopeptide repeat protein [Candidatus Limnocylindria bacterium]